MPMTLACHRSALHDGTKEDQPLVLLEGRQATPDFQVMRVNQQVQVTLR